MFKLNLLKYALKQVLFPFVYMLSFLFSLNKECKPYDDVSCIMLL